MLSDQKKINTKISPKPIYPIGIGPPVYNIPEAINWVFQTNDRAIILEDDCFPNQNFFSFCNELLEKYENDHCHVCFFVL